MSSHASPARGLPVADGGGRPPPALDVPQWVTFVLAVTATWVGAVSVLGSPDPLREATGGGPLLAPTVLATGAVGLAAFLRRATARLHAAAVGVLALVQLLRPDGALHGGAAAVQPVVLAGVLLVSVLVTAWPARRPAASSPAGRAGSTPPGAVRRSG